MLTLMLVPSGEDNLSKGAAPMRMKGDGCTTSRILSTIHQLVQTFAKNLTATSVGGPIIFT